MRKIQIDRPLLFLFLLIPVLSLIVLYSAGYDAQTSIVPLSWLPLELKSQAFTKQLVHFFLGIVVIFLCLLLNKKIIFKSAVVFYFVSILSLILVLQVGSETNNSVRWIPLGPLRFQPSEFTKLAVIMFFSWYCTVYAPKFKYSLRELLTPLLLLAVPLVLILKQPDLGTSITVSVIGLAVILLTGVQPKILKYAAIIFVLSLPLAWTAVLKPYQKQRVLTLLNPEADPYGSGYHIIQSKIAVGSGGLYGKGFLQGSQTQLEFLPEHTTDFIFSVLAEEWGFIGCATLLLLYFLLIRRLFYLAGKTEDNFAGSFCFALGIMLASHVFVNIGMVIGILPVVGLPLPLFSYGGSALLTICLAFGFVLRLTAREKEF